nr:hypothetical protein [uncultured Mediterranean phage uvMED]|tara:strand:+ start:948 stop:1217 length:270 start_codon:yes stop_codon:yes gene_type:complete
MAKYEIELTNTEDKAMQYVCADIQKWIALTVKDRARIAKDEIIAANMTHCNANEVTIATGVDKQVEQAFELKAVKTAKEIMDAEETKPE